MSIEYPEKWEVSPLSDINDYSSSSMQPKNHTGEVFELFSVPIFPTGKPEIAEASAIGSSKQRVKPNDVLISKINPRINRVWRVTDSVEFEQIASSEWIVVRSNYINAQYLTWYFRSDDFRSRLCADVSGVGGSLTRAQPKKVATFEIPLPPLAEQKVIADKLDTLLAQVESTKARLQRLPDILKRFRQSVLSAAVSGKLTEEWRSQHKSGALELESYVADILKSRRESHVQSLEKSKRKSKYKEPVDIDSTVYVKTPDSWVVKSLDLVTSRITYGLTVRPKYVEKGVPIISAKEIKTGEVDFISAKKFDTDDFSKQREKSKIFKNDILFSKTGSIGHVAHVRIDAPMCSSQNIAVLSPLINPLYLTIVLRSRLIQDLASTNVKANAIPDLQLGIMSKFPVPLPSSREQSEIVRRVEELFQFADQIEQKANAALERVNNLTQSILAKAFRGELTADWRAQNPDLISGENSAEALLEKIKAEREKLKPKKKTAREKAKG